MKLAKAVRIVTAPPMFALALLVLLYFLSPGSFTLLHYLLGILFLTVLPLLAYPVARLNKKAADPRAFERTLAIIFSVAGYICGTVMALVFGGSDIEKYVFLTYLFSGILTALLSFVFKLKSSGHACGVSGPIAMLAYCLGWPWLFCYVIMAAVVWSSLKMKRHTPLQLAIGSVVPLAAMAAAICLVKFAGI